MVKIIPCGLLIVIYATSSVLTAPSKHADSAEMNKRITKICFEKHEVGVSDIEEFHKNFRDPPKKMLCYMKCFLERKGLIDETGKINVDNFSGENYEDDITPDDNRDSDGSVSDEGSTNDDLECLTKLEPIKTCNDIKALLKCIPEIKRK